MGSGERGWIIGINLNLGEMGLIMGNTVSSEILLFVSVIYYI